MEQHPTDESRRVFLNIKNNLKAKQPGLSCKVIEHDEHVSLEWDDGPVHKYTAEMAVILANKGSLKPREVAINFLMEALKDGPRFANEVIAEAATHGMTTSTLFRARKEAGVRSSGRGRETTWFPPLDCDDDDSC